MHLLEIVALRHGVDRAKALAVLRRRCLSWRVVATVAVLGAAFPRLAGNLQEMVQDIGQCQSRKDVQNEILFHKERWRNSGFGLIKNLFSLSGRRILRVSHGYFAWASTAGVNRSAPLPAKR